MNHQLEIISEGRLHHQKIMFLGFSPPNLLSGTSNQIHMCKIQINEFIAILPIIQRSLQIAYLLMETDR